MSNALALAGVTAVLKDLLDNALVDASINAAVGQPVTVTALAPDLIDAGSLTAPQLNLYLYRVEPSAAWRNLAMPARAGDGQRLATQPLALDLHYLLSAYGTQDYEAEILLGYAMLQLHERPVLTPATIRTALAAPSAVDGSILPPAFQALAAADLAEQAETVKVSPVTMGTEELSRLWAAFQAHYRPSAAYRASVVLLEQQAPRRVPLPVLTLGTDDRGPAVQASLVPPLPTLESIEYPGARPRAHVGDVLILHGHHLEADPATPVVVELAHPRLPAPLALTPSLADEARLGVALNPAAALAGIYGLAVALTRDGTPRRTNALPLVVAPRIDGITATTASGATTFSVQTTPEVQPAQDVALVVGTREASAQPHPAPTSTLTFEVEGLAPGTYPVRLRVDGVESVLIDHAATPPAFLASQQVTV